MSRFIVSKTKLSGHAEIPSSKSHSLRAILFASLACGESLIENYLLSPDAVAMIHACRMLGADIEELDQVLRISGVAGKPSVPDDVINSGNSGQVLRFVGAIAGLIDGYTVITGDDSVRHNRPVKPLLLGLEQLGAKAVSSRGDDRAPIIIQGKMQAGTVKIDGQDSQPVSGLLIATQFLADASEIYVDNAGEKPWIQLTLSWFDRLGLRYQNNDFNHYKIPGHANIQSFNYKVPGDFSSLAFPVAAALISGSQISISPVDMSDSQGDKKLLDVFTKMGAEFDIDEQSMTLHVKVCARLTGISVDINDFVDSVTILAVVACFADGETVIKNASIARQKECNRLQAICTELTKMGADIQETDDGLIVRQSKLKGCKVKSYHDHRMVMSLTVAGLIADGETEVDDVTCVGKSFPGFAKAMQAIGMSIEVLE